ncbi:hypothetical protein CMQ_7392 [Grosmannia clavigera kw1407]|uniref:Uncharacterized protein n=1 Tax=Grosmannia clavigera (strain kw1407 / UAMH 11150) TaxID=655863 RepID=F0XPD5_GROCL|nr:uncharacterized protein CMQ_7392 [Grosmannia clavigera kw1407]EFX00390.1 hypothetical protein CMQ_7392 [Grosmannia clavigera kw1407]
MTDVKAPVSASVFSEHSHFPIGHAPVLASISTSSPAAEQAPKLDDAQSRAATEVNKSTGTKPEAKTGEEPVKDAVDKESGGVTETPPAAEPSETPSAAEKEVAIFEPLVLAVVKDDAPDVPATATGAVTAEAAVGDKRKADTEDQPADDGVLPLTEDGHTSDELGESAAKKAKIELATQTESSAASDEADPAVVGCSTANGAHAKKGAGRTKKEKKTIVPAVGRTARKTRSQGPVDA